MSTRNRSAVHVLLTHHQGKIGGGERSILNLAACIDRGRFQFTVACPCPSPLSDRIESMGIPVIPVAFSRVANAVCLLRNTRKLIHIARKYDIDLLHGNGPQTNVACGLAGRIIRRPVLWHARNILEHRMLDLDRILAGLTTHIVSNSQAIRNRFKRLSAYEAKTSVILNGVDTTVFAPDPKKHKPLMKAERIPDNSLVAGMFDRLDPRKKHEDVIDACACLRDRFPQLILLIAGKAFVNHERRLRQLQTHAQMRGIAERVRFLGFRNDIPDLMNACDVIVLAARDEGCSRTLCEAQSTGVPVVAADDGGNRELVADGESGYLFAAGNSEKLSERLAELLSSSGRRQAMGAAARRHAQRELSIHRYCEQMAKLYLRLTGI